MFGTKWTDTTSVFTNVTLTNGYTSLRKLQGNAFLWTESHLWSMARNKETPSTWPWRTLHDFLSCTGSWENSMVDNKTNDCSHLVGLWDHLAVCVCMWIPPNNFWMPEPDFIKLGMYIFTCRGHLPVTVAARFKAWTVFARSDAGIVGSNPIQGMDVRCVCMRLFWVCVVLCLGRDLATSWSLVQGILPSVKNDYGTE
jgi:hypothetical protein